MDTNKNNEKSNVNIKNEFNKLVKEKSEFLDYLSQKLRKTTGIELPPSKDMKFYVDQFTYYLENIIENIPASVYWLDKKNFYLGCNNYTAKLLGLNSKWDIRGKKDEELAKIHNWPPEVIQQFHQANKAVLKGEKIINQEELPFETSGGKKMYQLTNRIPLYDQKGNIIGVLGISIDITDQKKMQMELKAAKKKAEEFNALKSKFIQNMEHDIRTPAAGLEQTLFILLSKEKDPSKKEIIQFSLNAAEELKVLLNSVLHFGRLKYDNPLLEAPLNLSNVFHSIYKLNWPTANIQNLQFYYKIDERIPSIVISDEHRIKHILLNLVGNALKFTSSGEVFFKAKLVRQKGRNLLIEFIVKDTGIGIPENKQDIIFERFVRLDDSNRGIYKGAGVGLANVKEYVDQLGGEFKPIQSIEGKGSTFVMLIPMKASLDQQMELSSHSTLSKEEIEFFKRPVTKSLQNQPLENESYEANSFKKKATPITVKKNQVHVLLVEDSLLAQRMAESVLSKLDCELDIASTAKDALKLISKNKYDLIFSDIGLPDMDGIEMVRHIRYEEHKKAVRPIPIIGQSAQFDASSKKACIGVGMQDLIAKPFTQKIIKELLNNYIPQYAQKHSGTIKFSKKHIYNKQVIDRELFENITRNDPNTIKNFITLTQDMLETDLIDFEKAYQNRNWKKLLFFTHKLRGGFVCIAAMRLEETCGHLEEYLREYKDNKPNLTSIKAMHNTILKEIQALKKEIKNNLCRNSEFSICKNLDPSLQ